MIPPPFLSTLTSPSLEFLLSRHSQHSPRAGSAPRFPPSPLWIYFVAQGSIRCLFPGSPAGKLLSKAGTKLFIIINIQRRGFFCWISLWRCFSRPKKPPCVDVLEEPAAICGITGFFRIFRGNKVMKVLWDRGNIRWVGLGRTFRGHRVQPSTGPGHSDPCPTWIMSGFKLGFKELEFVSLRLIRPQSHLAKLGLDPSPGVTSVSLVAPGLTP